MRIPAIFKNDHTDRILFVEDVGTFIGNFLLKGKEVSDELYNEILIDYEQFINTTDVDEFDEYALEYFSSCIQIVEIVKKYYLKKN